MPKPITKSADVEVRSSATKDILSSNVSHMKEHIAYLKAHNKKGENDQFILQFGKQLREAEETLRGMD